MTGQRTLAIVALLAASALCVATVEIRTYETGDAYYRFLVWNLILAWVPLAFAIAAYSRARSRIDLLVAVLLVPWLLFFPNAPYLLSDFIHLGEGPAPLWYDGLMLSAFAWTGLLLGFGSLYLVQMIVRRAFGGTISWLGVLAAVGPRQPRCVRRALHRVQQLGCLRAPSTRGRRRPRAALRGARDGRPRGCSPWRRSSSSATSPSTASPV